MPAASAAVGPSSQLRQSDRQPWQSTLYQVVRDNVATLYEASEDGFGTPLPKFVRAELDGYLRCWAVASHTWSAKTAASGICWRSAVAAERFFHAAPVGAWPNALRYLLGYHRTLCAQVMQAIAHELMRARHCKVAILSAAPTGHSACSRARTQGQPCPMHTCVAVACLKGLRILLKHTTEPVVFGLVYGVGHVDGKDGALCRRGTAT